ncbi:hypothetical protein DICPUDRAFT_81838 [Dictyostelium purpureum]|uniref:FAD dependent oxidoreductase domain-containing protein n=1 Tax=Dictyostelium purpureum TaxID=5786 RepID=F0ZUR1_DICPU|nr:uncharacterized protein DICPUDRAFT_81838 [Dictyostelium purpureum]EGC32319.1 hypothetical protein DICPUDRAFT_81838 [Dictyostelium purpureum]|eukprot:XP_003291161.1 hypothetical protein DICPUDRAFT_81838 [Dictyostelium purpureum]
MEKTNQNTSYWEKSLLSYDYLVIGSGIVGLSTSISIKEKSPNSSVLVLEREVIPTGASGKNAGFSCIGSLTEVLDDLKTMSEKDVVSLVETRYKGLQLLRKRLGDHNIDYKQNGSYELIDPKSDFAKDKKALLKHIEEINDLLKPVLKGDAFSLCSEEETASFKFSPKICKYLIKNNFEGEIDTGKMLRHYTDLAISWGVHIKTGCKVMEYKDDGVGSVSVKVFNHTLGQPIEFIGKKLAICTNAFTKELVKDIDVVPGRGQVIITNPIPNLHLQGIYHFDEGYYYFREKDGCILFGGGRNLDFEGERTTEFKSNKKILKKLDELLKEIIPGVPYTIQQNWSGIMAFSSTKDKKPIINQHSKNVYLGVRMGGMGVAIGSVVGKILSDMMLDDHFSMNTHPSFLRSKL